ncbi:hypothetical protein EZJ49_09255 [Bdellovibrio bacteriovorus]|uniref:hypothetical protein n=1 Tax=Bdellovibrio bacteriovorus TaxID=959 RepID=UPI0021D2F27D|nr:hypothetical protein [Bdellovibrio bacteriovorus]UXR63265.1 hypothetical protein EZJ49_09255 [Bdellovibrio bacteriovorus]
MGLKKNNPLFLDSTRPVGDKLITNVELLEARLEQGQAFYIEVTDSFGVLQKHALKLVVTKKSTRYCAELWLNQSEEIQYRFILIAAGAELKSSELKQAVAGNSISEKWIPTAVPQVAAAKGKGPKKSKSTEIKKVGSGKGQSPLVAAQDYQQMKFLLGELE